MPAERAEPDPQPPTRFTAVTYNLWHGRGEQDLPDLVERDRPDLLHLQEVTVAALPERFGALRRVAMSTRGGYGVALFVRDDRFVVEDAASFALPRSLHDRITGASAERLAAARVVDERTGQRLVVATLHATPMTDPNVVRRRQIGAAQRSLERLGPGLPALLAGDFNYPYFTRALDRRLHRRGYTSARSAVGTYHGWVPARGAFDIALVRGLTVDATTTLPRGESDHRPVRFEVRFDGQGQAGPILARQSRTIRPGRRPPA